MADGKNIQLDDELLMGANGGFVAPEQRSQTMMPSELW